MLNRHFSIYLGAHLVPAVIGFFAITIYTRLLTPHEYGVYVVGMGVAGIIGAVCFAWIRMSVARYQATSADIDFRGTAILAFGLTVAAIAALAPAALLLFHFDISIDVVVASVFVAVAVGAFDISQEFQRATLRPMRFAVIVRCVCDSARSRRPGPDRGAGRQRADLRRPEHGGQRSWHGQMAG